MTFMMQWFFLCVCVRIVRLPIFIKKQIYATVKYWTTESFLEFSRCLSFKESPKLEDDFQNDVTVDKLDTLGKQSSSE